MHAVQRFWVKERINSVKGYSGFYCEKAHEYVVWANVCDF